MKNIYIFLILFCLSCQISCSGVNQVEKLFNKAVMDLTQDIPDLTEKVSYYVVIPYGGCSACINEAEILLQKYYQDERVLFILTGFPTEKEARLRYGEAFKSKQVILDDKNLLSVQPLVSIYPYFFRNINGTAVHQSIQSPDNSSVFEELEAELQ